MYHIIRHSYQFFFIAIFILFIISDGYGEKNMQPVYSLNKAVMQKIEPEVYPTKKVEIQGLLAVPIDGMIATNMLPRTNAVTRIEFMGKKLKYKTVAKNFKSYVGGGNTTYMPIFSEDWIGYSQNRGFTLLNIKTKECRYYSIAGDTNMRIAGVDVIDAEKFIFMFHIPIIPVGGYDFFSDDAENKKYYQLLRVMDLSKEEGVVISEKKISTQINVTNNKDVLFFSENNTVKSYNLKFEEIDHPLVDVLINKYKSENKICYLTIHPNLPFAVFGFDAPESYQLYVIRWDFKNNDNKQKIFHIIEDGLFYKFSYDGKWLLSNSTVAGKKSFVILPVDKDLPHYLGPPIYLGEVPSFPSGAGSSAMTRNPSGLVVSDCTNTDECVLKKWNFTEAEKLIEKKK